MSIDITLTQDVDFGGPTGPERLYLHEFNVTYNLAPMWRRVGLDLQAVGGLEARELGAKVRGALDVLQAEEEACRRLTPPNRWGSYEGLVEALRELARACERYPRARVTVRA